MNSTFDRPRQNKANPGAVAHRAKQTQFFDCGPGSASGVTTLRIGHRPAMGHPARAARPGGEWYKQTQSPPALDPPAAPPPPYADRIVRERGRDFLFESPAPEGV